MEKCYLSLHRWLSKGLDTLTPERKSSPGGDTYKHKHTFLHSSESAVRLVSTGFVHRQQQRTATVAFVRVRTDITSWLSWSFKWQGLNCQIKTALQLILYTQNYFLTILYNLHLNINIFESFHADTSSLSWSTHYWYYIGKNGFIQDF